MAKGNIIKSAARATGLFFKKNSPIILTVAGITGFVAAGVLACRSTLKAGDIIDEAKADLDDVKEAKKAVAEAIENSDDDIDYDEEKFDDYETYLKVGAKKEIAGIYGKAALNFLKLYGPSIILAAGSIVCILSGHKIMRKRNAAIAAAYATLDRSYSEYRKRVKDKYGEEEELKIRHGERTETVEKVVKDSKGKEKKQKEEVSVVDSPSGYARFFDEASEYWTKSPEQNLFFVKSVEEELNWMLESRKDGVVFLNEAYKKLGIPLTQAGQFVGWKYDGTPHKIDLGIFNSNREKCRDFVNGYERCIIIDPNVDGVIWNELKEDQGLDFKGSGNF